MGRYAMVLWPAGKHLVVHRFFPVARLSPLCWRERPSFYTSSLFASEETYREVIFVLYRHCTIVMFEDLDGAAMQEQLVFIRICITIEAHLSVWRWFWMEMDEIRLSFQNSLPAKTPRRFSTHPKRK